MGPTRSVSLLLTVAGLAAAVVSLPDRVAAMEVGRISDLDLEQVKALIEKNTDALAPAALEQQSLTLEESLEVALENNLDIQIAVLGLEAQAPEVAAAKSVFHPDTGFRVNARGNDIATAGAASNSFDQEQIEAFVRQALPTGGALGVRAGYQRDFSDDPDGSNTGETEIAGFTVEARQPLLRGGRTFVARRQILNAEIDAEIEAVKLDGEILKVTAETKGAYYGALEAERQIDVIEQAIERDRELIDYSTALFDAGRVSKRDVVSAEIQLSDDQIRLSRRRAALELAQNNLRDVLGLPIEVRVETTDDTIPFYPIPLELAAWLESAYQNRPELRTLDKELERMELAVRLRRNDILPQLDVAGEYQRDVTFTKGQAWRAGVEFSVPFGNVGARSLLTQAETQMARLRREYSRQKRAIELDVRAIEIQLREGLLRLRTLAIGVEQARAKREIARGRFENGLANNFDITDADRSLVNAETALLRGLVDYASNLAELEAKIGRQL